MSPSPLPFFFSSSSLPFFSPSVLSPSDYFVSSPARTKWEWRLALASLLSLDSCPPGSRACHRSGNGSCWMRKCNGGEVRRRRTQTRRQGWWPRQAHSGRIGRASGESVRYGSIDKPQDTRRHIARSQR